MKESAIAVNRGVWQILVTRSCAVERVTTVVNEDDTRPGTAVSSPHDPLVAGLESFDAFYRREIRRLVGLAYALSGSRFVADDIAQEAMLAAYRKWDEVGRLESPSGWVRRVVSNQAASTVRRRIAEAKGLTRWAGRQPASELPEVPADTEWIWGEVRRLPKRQMQVIALRFYDQLSLSEIAEVLGCSKASANTHLRRARQTLDRRLMSRGDSL